MSLKATQSRRDRKIADQISFLEIQSAISTLGWYFFTASLMEAFHIQVNKTLTSNCVFHRFRIILTIISISAMLTIIMLI